MRRPDLMIASADPALRKRLAETLAGERGLPRLHEAGDRAETERLVARLTPPVLLLDLPLPGYAGLESLQAIQTLSPTTRTIVLVARPVLRRAVQQVRDGEIWVGRSVTTQLLEELTAASTRRAPGPARRLGRLTQRERELVALVAAGASNKEIADRLSIAERTVKAHLTSIFRKLGVSSRLHLAVYTLEAEGFGQEKGPTDQSPIDRRPRS